MIEPDDYYEVLELAIAKEEVKHKLRFETEYDLLLKKSWGWLLDKNGWVPVLFFIFASEGFQRQVEPMNRLENVNPYALHSGSGLLRVGTFGTAMACALAAKRAVAQWKNKMIAL